LLYEGGNPFFSCLEDKKMRLEDYSDDRLIKEVEIRIQKHTVLIERLEDEIARLEDEIARSLIEG
jgi:hypothetical protein